ncbi:hypothetical protein LTR28_010802, partial [Elasticomyces elasticus]
MDSGPDPYTWDGVSGWKSYRMLRPGRGMYYDVRRRLPFYWSDITDGFNYRTFAATVRMYFVNLLPALAFQLDMTRQTGGYFGVNEALFASALAAIVFSTLGAQPLTIVGITGLISLFNYTIYAIAERQHVAHLYPEFICWVSIWAAVTHWIASLVKGVEELIDEFTISTPAAGFLGIVVALCYWFTVYGLELTGGTILFSPVLRKVLSDYAYP